MAGNIAVTAVLCIIVSQTVFFSGFFIFLFIKRKRLRTAETAPVHILLTTLAVVDLVAAVFWTLLAAISALEGKWDLPDELCNLQVFVTGFFSLMNAHILLTLMFERFLKVYKPSKHVEIVFDSVVLLLIGTLVILDSAIAACPLWGWGQPEYFSDQYQCAVDYEQSVSVDRKRGFQLIFFLPPKLCVPRFSDSLISPSVSKFLSDAIISLMCSLPFFLIFGIPENLPSPLNYPLPFLSE